MSQSSSVTRTFLRPFAEEDASDHRIKLYKYMARLSGDEASGESEFERRAARQRELAASRHPRWRGTDSR
jgi:hypothetical protein